jgi:hypothetical protein
MMSKEDIVKKIRSKKRLVKSLGISKLSLFGSALYETQDEKSDIDLLVRFEGSQSIFRIIKAQMELEKYLGKGVDLVTEDSLSVYFRDKVLSEMETIIDEKS